MLPINAVNQVVPVTIELQNIKIIEQWSWFSSFEKHTHHMSIDSLEELKPILPKIQ